MTGPRVPVLAGVDRRWRAARLLARQGGGLLRGLTEERLPGRRGPIWQGTQRVAGLHGTVEILRDDAGVPHVFAESAQDALFALGYVHALDRSWQMEFYRRVAAGRMAEVAGPAGLPADRFTRHLGLPSAAQAAWEATPPAERSFIEAYARGVNAALRVTPPPLECRILGYPPEPWAPWHSGLWAKFLSFMLAPAWDSQVRRARLIEHAGLDAVRAVDPGYPAAAPVIAPPGAPYGALTAELVAEHEALIQRTGLGTAGFGSNNWAVAPAHTASGHAILAGDPHLAAVFPALGYFVHLDCPEWSAAGASIPGLPGIIWGFNRHLAWAATAGLASTQNAYVEEFDSTGLRYRTPEGWATAAVREETIAVRGHTPETVPVRVTRHGPVISPEVPGVRQAIALESSVLEGQHAGSAVMAMLAAHDADAFRAAAMAYRDFNLTFAFATVDGHIGTQVTGAIPRRRPGAAWLPAPGWDPAFDRDGYLAPEDLPCTVDPPGGRAWSANNAPTTAAPAPAPPASRGASAAYAGEYMDGYRAARIGAALQADSAHTIERAMALQIDRYSAATHALALRLARLPAPDPDERALLARLADWDGQMLADSVPAALASATFSRVLDAVLRARLGSATALYLGPTHTLPGLNAVLARSASLVERLVAEEPTNWFQPPASDGPAAWTVVLLRAFREAVALLRQRLGPNPDRWTWGRCHRVSLAHALGEAPPLDRLLNLGPFSVGGDGNTVVQTGPLSTDPFERVTTIPALRLAVELAPEPHAVFTLAGGQSGWRRTPHHVDLLADWRHGRTRPLSLRRTDAEARAESRLRLTPRPGAR